MELKDALSQHVEMTKVVFREMDWADADVYANWLSQTYYFVSHTTRLLALAAGTALLNEQNYHEQFLYHLKEEAGHEKLALNDLKALEKEVSPELSSTKQFYFKEYQLIREVGPIGLFGYMMYLENLAVYAGPGIYEAATKVHGKKAGRFLAVHINEDVEHVEVTLKTLNSIKQTDKDLICSHIEISSENYRNILKQISASPKAQGVA
ncbi:MAG: iron-containing redox enzyme family protein [Bdellovibrionales bacterium]|nr:iron-containing redox enzyme family protein [Bdellovibrionales bacterium]